MAKLVLVSLLLVVAVASTANPYESKLIGRKDNPLICLVANGTCMGIPDVVTYQNLFG